ncbi:MAG: DPP IV N-terminal domain-containing protein, partial [bacterium]|nr:DPP IV N-terminal domain-containing protein [bacterium]
MVKNSHPSASAFNLDGTSLSLMLFAVAGTACAPSASQEPIAHWRSSPAEPVAQIPAHPLPTATTSPDSAAPTSTAFLAASTSEPADEAFVVEGLTPATFGEEGDDFDPSISRDGSRLVFASTQHRQTSDIYVKNVAGRVVTQLTNDPAEDAMPVFSPDGSRIAFASNRQGNWDIFIMAATGGKALQLTDGAEDEVFPSWSPDGSTLVFSRQNLGTSRWEMWTLPLGASGNPSFIGFGYRPRWCPMPGTGLNGTDRVLYQLGRERGSRSFGIWTIDVGPGTAGQPSMLASSREKAFINPEWSPDGEWIAYAQAAPTAAPTATNAR